MFSVCLIQDECYARNILLQNILLSSTEITIFMRYFSTKMNFSNHFLLIFQLNQTLLCIFHLISKAVIETPLVYSHSTLWMPRTYIYVLQWSSPWPQMFFRNNHGRIYTPLVVCIMSTWSLHILHRDVYIRPWLLMPKQRGIQRVCYIKSATL